MLPHKIRMGASPTSNWTKLPLMKDEHSQVPANTSSKTINFNHNRVMRYLIYLDEGLAGLTPCFGRQIFVALNEDSRMSLHMSPKRRGTVLKRHTMQVKERGCAERH